MLFSCFPGTTACWTYPNPNPLTFALENTCGNPSGPLFFFRFFFTKTRVDLLTRWTPNSLGTRGATRFFATGFSMEARHMPIGYIWYICIYIYIYVYMYIYDLKIKPLASGVLGGAEDYQINTQRNHFKFEQLNSLRSQKCFWKKGNIPNSQQKISKNYNEAVPPFSFEKKQGRGPPTLTNHRSTQPPTTSPNRL